MITHVAVVWFALAGCGLFRKPCDEGFKYWKGRCYLSAEAAEPGAGPLTPGGFAQRYTTALCEAIDRCGSDLECPKEVDYPAECNFHAAAARDCLAGEWECGPEGPLAPAACERVFECEDTGRTNSSYY